MRDPFANISIDDLRDKLDRYSAIQKLFNRRCRKLVEKGLSFYELPLLYKWLLVRGHLGLQMLSTRDKCLTNLNGRDTNLDRKIKNLGSTNSDDQVFRLLTEFLVISNLVSKGIADFQYEDVPGSDIGFDFEGLPLRIQIMHKEDVYALAETADKLSINLEYASPDSGGDIRVAPPIQQNYSDGSIVHSHNMTEDEVQTTIRNALNLIRSNPPQRMTAPCPNPFFTIKLDPWSRHWGISWSRSRGISLSDPSNDPYIRSYVDSMKRKAGKSLEIKDGSYMILAVDFTPVSLFGPNSRLRDLLRNQLLALDLARSSNFNEVVSFTMRFETGEIESLELLWKRDTTSASIFKKLIQ
jgi:hypothetical protein